nr:PREDICTED: yrdC domain-containing protein, mitochondrial [Megachile rotundata]
MKTLLNSASMDLKTLRKSNKHWNCRGRRSVAIAATLLQQNSIVAIPTDTVYGLAGVVSNNATIQMLYNIKSRDTSKPLSISVSSVSDIKMWGITDHLPADLLPTILPGPYTVILKRTPALNPALNPDIDTVGIRVPKFHFINCVSRLTGPLALTSANESNEPSCLYASEFEKLWPLLGGIFYDGTIHGRSNERLRKGSTIVDLSQPGCYKIVRRGVGALSLCITLKHFGLEKDESN